MKAGIIPGANCIVYQYNDNLEKYIRKMKTIPRMVLFDTNEVLYTPNGVIAYNEYTNNNLSSLEFLDMLGLPEEIDRKEIMDNILIDIGGLLVIINIYGYVLLTQPTSIEDSLN